MIRVKSVLLLSGGLDSAANLAFCKRLDEPVLALTVDYGQKAADAEIRSARKLTEIFDVPHQIVDLRWFAGLGGSSLTTVDGVVPTLLSEELDDAAAVERSSKSVWVPNRNGVLINMAAAFAEALGAAQVVVGFNREEAVNFPDNTIEFMWRATEALKHSTSNGVRVHSYTASLDKREIVESLDRDNPDFPFERIWSCYQGGQSPCGVCESCRRLERALGFRKSRVDSRRI